MSCSLPVIASNRGYLPHLIEDGANGLLVDPEDPSSLVNALLELADNPERRLAMGQKNRAIVASKYTWCSRADQYENLFRITKSG
jgi:glycosyltransferase involved in cell wall biosynthesis